MPHALLHLTIRLRRAPWLVTHCHSESWSPYVPGYTLQSGIVDTYPQLVTHYHLAPSIPVPGYTLYIGTNGRSYNVSLMNCITNCDDEIAKASALMMRKRDRKKQQYRKKVAHQSGHSLPSTTSSGKKATRNHESHKLHAARNRGCHQVHATRTTPAPFQPPERSTPVCMPQDPAPTRTCHVVLAKSK